MRTRLALVIATLCLLGGPGATVAGAATRLVTTGGSDAANTCLAGPCRTIAHAVSVAVAGDTISIGPGTFPEQVSAPVALNFVGNGGGTADAPAAGGTFIDATLSSSPALDMPRGGTVTGLRLRGGGSSGGPLSPSAPALNCVPSGPSTLVVSDTTVLQTPAGGPSSGSNGAIHLSATVAQPLTATFEGVNAVGQQDAMDAYGLGTNATVDHSLLIGGLDSIGLAGYAAGALNLTDSTASDAGGEHYGVLVQNETVNVARSTLSGRNAGLIVASAASLPAVANVSDSVLQALPVSTTSAPIAAAIVTGSTAPDSGTLNLSGITAVARGPHAAAAVLATQGSGGGATAHLDRSIAVVTDTVSPQVAPPALQANGATGPAAITATRSLFATSSGVAGGTVPAVGSATNVVGDPLFADPATGDLHLLAGSPAIDLGDPASLTSGETDLDGHARSLAGACGAPAAPDAGAYESAAPPCPIETPPVTVPPPTTVPIGRGPGTTPATKLTLSNVSLSPARLRPRVRHGKHTSGGTTLHFTLSAATSLRATVQRVHRRAHHRTTYTTAGHALRIRGRSGTNRVTITATGLKPGAYRLTLTATAPAGMVAPKAVTLAFSIVPAVQKRAHH